MVHCVVLRIIKTITFAILKYFFASSIFPEALADIAAFLNWVCRSNRNAAFCSERLCADTNNHKSHSSIKSCIHPASHLSFTVANVSIKLTSNYHVKTAATTTAWQQSSDFCCDGIIAHG